MTGNPEFGIRNAEFYHIPQILIMQSDGYTDVWSEGLFKNALESPNYRAFVYAENEQVFGFAVITMIAGESSLENIAVDARYRNKGIGTALLNKAIEETEKDCEFITLEVRKSNKNAIRLYEKFGFETVGERKNYYSKPVENGLLMTKYFKGEELYVKVEKYGVKGSRSTGTCL